MIAIDIGGTFTDSVITNKKGKVFKVAKTASTPSNPSQGFIKSVTKVLKLADVDPSSVEVVLQGSTVVTNAILENKGAKTAKKRKAASKSKKMFHRRDFYDATEDREDTYKT